MYVFNKWKFILPVLAVFMISATANAADATKTSKGIQELGKLEVTGSRLAEDITDVPAPAYVITKEEIDSMGARNVSEVLDRIPGVTGLSNGSSSMTQGQGVKIRGLGSEILLLVDGVPFINAYGMSGSNAFDLRTIPMDSIERIEVVKGASSAIYGSAAAAGVINIITRKGEGKSTGFLKAESGSGGFFRGTARGTVELNNDFRVTAGYTKTKETSDVKLRRKNATNLPALYDYGKHYDGNDFTFRVDKDFWSLIGDWGNFDSEWEYNAVPQFQKNDYARMSLNYNDGVNVARVYYHNNNKHFRNINGIYSENNKYTNSTVGAAFNRKQELFGVPVVYGIDWRQEKIKVEDFVGAPKVDYDKTRNGFAPYLEASVPVGQANLDLGLRYENWSVDDAENVSELIPRLSLNWESPSGKLWYVTAGRYFMMPSFSQMFYEAIGSYPAAISPNLKPEKGWTYDIGVKDESAKHPWKLGVFYMDMEDKIAYNFATSAVDPAYINVSEYRAWGFEGQYKFNINDNWSLMPGFSYTHAEEKASKSAEWLRSMDPRWDISAFLNYKKDAWAAELSAHYYGDRILQKTGKGAFANDNEDIFIVNASVSWELFDNQKVRLTCANLFDKEFVLGSSGYINPERKIIVSWECTF